MEIDGFQIAPNTAPLFYKPADKVVVIFVDKRQQVYSHNSIVNKKTSSYGHHMLSEIRVVERYQMTMNVTLVWHRSEAISLEATILLFDEIND